MAKEKVGIFTFWFNRGLANLSKDLISIIEKDYDIRVLARADDALNPEGTKLESFVTSEKDMTLSDWVKDEGIDKLIVMQFLDRQSEYAKIKAMGVKLIIIPMIEWVAQNEIQSLELFDKIICPTKYTYDVLTKLKEHDRLKESELVHYKYAIDPTKFKDAPLMFFNGNELRVLCDVGWGGWEDRKNIEYALLGFLKASATNKKITLVFKTQKPVNEYSPMINEILTLIPKKQLKIIEGDIPFDELLRVRAECHIFLSATGFTGLELGIQEAMSIGQPILTMDVPPINEFITEQTGFLYKAKYGIPMGHNFIYKYKPDVLSMAKALKGITVEAAKIKGCECYEHMVQMRQVFIKEFKL